MARVYLKLLEKKTQECFPIRLRY